MAAGSRTTALHRVPLLGLALLPLLVASAARGQGPELPAGGTVVAGAAAIGAPAGSSLIVTQSSPRAILDWERFSIGQGASVRFDNGAGATLNRVTGAAVSSIDGILTATGSVYLLNRNGVVIGRSGVVDVGGRFVASTLDVRDDGFMAGGDLAFSGTSGAAVINLGRVGALGGDVALIASRVENRGSIAAANGTVGLAAGTDVLLRDAALDGGRFVVRVGGAGTGATNVGTIAAAAAELRANGGNVYALAGDTGGAISATGVAAQDGRIWLTAGDAGSVTVAGSLTARGADGRPAAIETSGGAVAIGAATIDAGAGGTWLLDPTDLAIDQTAANTIAGTLNAGTNVTQQTTAAGSGGSGDISVNPTVAITWNSGAALTLSAYRNVALGGGAALASTGGGAVTLYADNSGTGTGTVTFESGARVATSGIVSIVYNPASNPAGSGVNTTSYASPADYSANIGGGASLYAFMLVNTAADLQNMRNKLGGSYVLGRNLDAGALGSFAPVGSVSALFTGFFEGLYRSIANLNVAGAADDAGLFGVIGAGGIVREAVLAGGSVSGGTNVGALAGVNMGSILYSSSSAAVSGAVGVGGLVGTNRGLLQTVQGRGTVAGSDTVGGIVGDNAGTLNNSFASATVTGGSKLGGAAGRNSGTMIGDVATGDVVASNDFVGGLVGANDAPGIISNARATGRVTGAYHVGGLVGASTGGSVANSRAEGTVAGSGADVGGFVGYNAGAIDNDVATGAVSGGGARTGGLVGLNDSDGSVRNAAAQGMVSGSTAVGGLIGYNRASVDGAAASGAVVATGDAVGGLIGTNMGAITNSGAAGPVAGQTYVGGLIGTNGAAATLGAVLATGSVRGGDFVGGLIGENDGRVSGAAASGAVTASGIAAGGLIGASYGDVARSWATGAVRAREAAGGLVGANRAGLTDVYAQGAVTAGAGAADGQGAFGGLAGYNSGAVTRAYATGAVAGTHDVGGLVGVNDGGVISATYATGAVTGSDTHVGGLVGANGSFVYDSYWDAGTTGQASATGVNGAVVERVVALGGAGGADPYAQASYGAFAFGSGWLIVDRQTRPFLAAEYATTITNAHQLQLVASRPNASYVLANDVDLGELNDPAGLWNVATGFAPLGNGSAMFRGVFDGAGHALTGLRIDRANTSYVGLFGYSSGTIRNLALIGGSVTGGDYVGALAGIAIGGTISGITSSVAVASPGSPSTSGDPTESQTAVGGLVGNAAIALSNVSSSGSVTGGRSVGGLVGVLVPAGSITDAHASGAVTGSETVGGLVGLNAGTLRRVYATGAVTAASATTSDAGNIGGLVGYNHSPAYNGFTGGNASQAPHITSAYATGAVTGNGAIGGLIGDNDGIVDSVYATGAVEGRDSVGGLIGYSSGGLTNAYATGAVTGHHTNVGGLIGYNVSFGGNAVNALYSTGAVTYIADPGSTVTDDQKAVGGLIGTNLATPTASYWDVGTSGQTVGAGRFGNNATGIGGSTGRDPFQQSTYQGFDFGATWTISAGRRPALRSTP